MFDVQPGDKVPAAFLVSLLRPYRARTSLFVLASLAASMFDGVSAGLLVPLFVSLQPGAGYDQLPPFLRFLAKLFAGFAAQRQVELALAAVVAAVLLKNALLAVSTYLAASLSSRLTFDLRRRGFSVLMSVGPAFFHTTRAGDLVERLLAHTSRLEYLVVQVADLIVNLASFIALFLLLLLLSWKLTALAAVATGLVMLVLTAYVRFLARAGSSADILSRDLASALYETIAGITLIRATAQERRRTATLEAKANAYRAANRHIIFGNYLSHLLTEALGVIALAVICLAALHLGGGDRRLVMVQLIPFVYVLTRILPTIKELNRARAQIASRLPFAVQVHRLLRTDDKPFIANGVLPFTGLRRAIQFQDVGFAYNSSDAWAVRHIDLEILNGCTTAIVGASGIGKSTLVELLLRFYDPQEGAILIDGTPLPRLEIGSFRSRIGLVSQDVFLFNDTVAANIAFGVEALPAARIAEVARRAGADEFIRQLPLGYETVLGDRGVTISGGQRQRLSIARALLRDPDILILDEATSALDSRSELAVRRMLIDLYRDRTVLIIAHRLSSQEGIDRVVALEEGRAARVSVVSQRDGSRREGSQAARE